MYNSRATLQSPLAFFVLFEAPRGRGHLFTVTSMELPLPLHISQSQT